ncbi:exported hypothetical protein [Vibrio nigripulchritudo SFn27]|uniref:hypothetical protein n=1 Tax=Vibrio nigripulchritudo TaxID=28173 RepID=UPI0003B19AFB|nr:hypothetical protein [Vibrio nigripulchritudo]CCN86062.1 exported hypothetical protein [Vibrio nigripulchritudo BLFn1]CCN92050.1 exported hypothetical protein [Vibrio nigripulchritudo SFn27]CCO44084.1 exported hypothetical protein [Vibrio nigripulchritudo SFn135]
MKVIHRVSALLVAAITMSAGAADVEIDSDGYDKVTKTHSGNVIVHIPEEQEWTIDADTVKETGNGEALEFKGHVVIVVGGTTLEAPVVTVSRQQHESILAAESITRVVTQ